MAKNKQKWYVVWSGTEPGVYSTWAECKQRIHGIAGAKYKSYDSLAEAEAAYAAGYQAPKRKTGGEVRVSNLRLTPEQLSEFPEIDPQSIAVDAACSGNPGKMEYRCVYVFADPSMPKGQTVVYSDSRNAMLWVRQKKCKTTLPHTPQFAQAHDMIARAEKWLNENAVTNRVVKWETKRWGQIPADFGRKQH